MNKNRLFLFTISHVDIYIYISHRWGVKSVQKNKTITIIPCIQLVRISNFESGDKQNVNYDDDGDDGDGNMWPYDTSEN